MWTAAGNWHLKLFDEQRFFSCKQIRFWKLKGIQLKFKKPVLHENISYKLDNIHLGLEPYPSDSTLKGQTQGAQQ